MTEHSQISVADAARAVLALYDDCSEPETFGAEGLEEACRILALKVDPPEPVPDDAVGLRHQLERFARMDAALSALQAAAGESR